MTNPPAIIHCCHHKVMTVYFRMVLTALAEYLERPFVLNPASEQECRGAIGLVEHSDVQVMNWDVRGTHIIRDPLDVLVSGYFYHRHTNEDWCQKKEHDGTSFQEKLNALSFSEGLRLELERVTVPTIREMNDWDYHLPHFLELRYEDLIADRDHGWKRKIADHYGLKGDAHNKLVELLTAHSFESLSGRALGEASGETHLRQGKPGDWRNHLPDEFAWNLHLEFGSLFWRLGYGVGQGIQ